MIWRQQVERLVGQRGACLCRVGSAHIHEEHTQTVSLLVVR